MDRELAVFEVSFSVVWSGLAYGEGAMWSSTPLLIYYISVDISIKMVPYVTRGKQPPGKHQPHFPQVHQGHYRDCGLSHNVIHHLPLNRTFPSRLNSIVIAAAHDEGQMEEREQ